MKRKLTGILYLFVIGALLLSAVPMAVWADSETATVDSGIVMTDGASIRLDDNYGIRFEATVSKAFLEAHPDATYGMLIAPTDKITAGSDFTDSAMAEGDYVKRDSTKWAAENGDGSKTFRVALVGLNETATAKIAANTAFSARAYAMDGDKVYWSAYDSEKNSRAISDVALLAMQAKKFYATNETVKTIAALAESPLAFSYLNNENLEDADRFAVVGKGSVRFYGNDADAAISALNAQTADKSKVAPVRLNQTLKVGDKVEFDYRLMLSNKQMQDNQIVGNMLFWLTDGSSAVNEGSVYGSLDITYSKSATLNQYYCGAGISDGKGKTPFVQGRNTTDWSKGNRMAWDWLNYHVTIEILSDSAINNGKPYAYYTFRELDANGKETAYALTKIANFSQTCNENLTLVLGSNRAPYEITNVKVGTVGQFTKIGTLGENIDINADSFSYADGFRQNADFKLDESVVRVNLPLTVGQKITFTYTWNGTCTTAGKTGGALFWLGSVSEKGQWMYWQKDAVYTASDLVYASVSEKDTCDVSKAKIGNADLQVPFGGAPAFTNSDSVAATEATGKWTKMHYDVSQYQITIEVVEGTDGKAAFRYTIAETEEGYKSSWQYGTEKYGGPATYTYEHQTTYAAAELKDVSLFFTSLFTAYTVSDIAVANVQ